MRPRRIVLDADVLSVFFSKKKGELKGRKKDAIDILSGLCDEVYEEGVEFFVSDLVILEFLPGVWAGNRVQAREFIESCNRVSLTTGQASVALEIFREMYDKGYRRGSVTDLLNSFFAANLEAEVFGLDGCYKVHADFFEKETGINTYRLTID